MARLSLSSGHFLGDEVEFDRGRASAGSSTSRRSSSTLPGTPKQPPTCARFTHVNVSRPPSEDEPSSSSGAAPMAADGKSAGLSEPLAAGATTTSAASAAAGSSAHSATPASTDDEASAPEPAAPEPPSRPTRGAKLHAICNMTDSAMALRRTSTDSSHDGKKRPAEATSSEAARPKAKAKAKRSRVEAAPTAPAWLAGAVAVRLRTASGDPVYVAHASGAVFTTPAGAMCSFDDGDAFRLLQEGDAAGGCRFSLAAGPSGNAVEVAPPGGGDLSRGFLVAYRRLGAGGPAAFSLERLADDRWALVTPDRERVVAGRKLDDGSRNIRIGARGARGDFVVAAPDQ